MCEFISWIEHQGKIYYLDDNKLNTKEGRKLLKYLGDVYKDLPGHGSIRWYYPELNCRGKDKECTDFSTPNNFPPEIVEAIKKGLFVNFGACPQILTPSALDLFINSETGTIYAEWEKANAESEKTYAKSKKAYAKWEKVDAKWKKEDAEWEKANAEWKKSNAEWEKVYAEWKKSNAEWEKVYAESKKAEREKAYTEWIKAYAEWKKSNAEWERVYAESKKAEWIKVHAEWEKAYTEWIKAYAEWEKADKTYFWQLARVKKNRIKAWQ